MSLTRFISVALFILNSVFAMAQLPDTSRIIRYNDSTPLKADKKKIYSKPRTATIMSICLPGLGQIYNGKKAFWKVPLIYAGLGGFGYFFYTNNSGYMKYRNALRNFSADTAITHVNAVKVDGIPWDSDQLQSQKADYKKYRDLSIIGMAVVYLLNIIDANVEAHLKTFDISDDLSMQITPWQPVSYSYGRSSLAMGLTMKINFKK